MRTAASYEKNNSRIQVSIPFRSRWRRWRGHRYRMPPARRSPHGHALQMMGKPAALPPDGGGQRPQLKPSPRRIGKCIHHGVIGQREPTFDLQLAIHLVFHAVVDAHAVQPGPLLWSGQPRLVGHVSHHGRWVKHHAMTGRVESSCIALVHHDDGRDEHRRDDGDEVQQRAEPAPRHRVDREQP
ncbi:MAG: hypothetical protein QOK33_4617 [Mycobacterium sp.]|nr:hypothetical protein [Mycobacterium sp.]